jgi:hypothetical protein
LRIGGMLIAPFLPLAALSASGYLLRKIGALVHDFENSSMNSWLGKAQTERQPSGGGGGYRP